jgi:hypothetical protein
MAAEVRNVVRVMLVPRWIIRRLLIGRIVRAKADADLCSNANNTTKLRRTAMVRRAQRKASMFRHASIESLPQFVIRFVGFVGRGTTAHGTAQRRDACATDAAGPHFFAGIPFRRAARPRAS